MKILLYSLTGLISFTVALVALLALTGNLNKDAFDRLLNKQPPVLATPSKPADSLGPLAQEMKRKEEALKQREQELKQREAQVGQREQELVQLRTQLEAIQKEIGGTLEDSEKDRQVRLETVALTLAEMKPSKAAERLESMPVEEAAEILNLVKPKERGKIVEAMTTEYATRVLRALHERKL